MSVRSAKGLLADGLCPIRDGRRGLMGGSVIADETVVNPRHGEPPGLPSLPIMRHRCWVPTSFVLAAPPRAASSPERMSTSGSTSRLRPQLSYMAG